MLFLRCSFFALPEKTFLSRDSPIHIDDLFFLRILMGEALMCSKNARFSELRIFKPKIIFFSRDSPIHIDDLFLKNDFNGDGSDVFLKMHIFRN